MEYSYINKVPKVNPGDVHIVFFHILGNIIYIILYYIILYYIILYYIILYYIIYMIHIYSYIFKHQWTIK